MNGITRLMATASVAITPYELFNTNPVGFIWYWLIGSAGGAVVVLTLLAIFYGWWDNRHL